MTVTDARPNATFAAPRPPVGEPAFKDPAFKDPAFEDPAIDEPAIDEPAIDYRPLVSSAIQGAIVGLAIKVFVAANVALDRGASLEVRRIFRIVPFLAIRTTSENFIDVVTWSSFASILVTVLLVAVVRIRRRERHRMIVQGSLVGVATALLTSVIEVVRHVVDEPLVLPWWAAQGILLGLATIVVVSAFLPDAETNRPRGGDDATSDGWRARPVQARRSAERHA